jgi:hypothetical protein
MQVSYIRCDAGVCRGRFAPIFKRQDPVMGPAVCGGGGGGGGNSLVSYSMSWCPGKASKN